MGGISIMSHLFRALLLAMALAACGRGVREIDKQPQEPDVELPQQGTGVAPSAPISPPGWIGVWAKEANQCAMAPGTGNDAPVSLTSTEFLGYGERCRIGAAEEGTEGGWRLELVCTTDGVERIEAMDVDVDGTMLRLTRENVEEMALVRCEGKN
jgi:hypothetical protein